MPDQGPHDTTSLPSNGRSVTSNAIEAARRAHQKRSDCRLNGHNQLPALIFGVISSTYRCRQPMAPCMLGKFRTEFLLP